MHCYVTLRTGEVYSFTRHDKAQKFAGKNDGIYISGRDQLENEDTSELVSLYNTIEVANPLVRFRDRPTAISRVWKLLEDNAKPGPDTSRYDKSGRPSRFAGKKLFRNVAENPRKPGSHGHLAWEIIRDGMTYEEYMAEASEKQVGGGGLKHLVWCVNKRLITAD